MQLRDTIIAATAIPVAVAGIAVGTARLGAQLEHPRIGAYGECHTAPARASWAQRWEAQESCRVHIGTALKISGRA